MSRSDPTLPRGKTARRGWGTHRVHDGLLVAARRGQENRKSVGVDDPIVSAMHDQSAGAEALAGPVEIHRVADMTGLERSKVCFQLHSGDRNKTGVAD